MPQGSSKGLFWYAECHTLRRSTSCEPCARIGYRPVCSQSPLFSLAEWHPQARALSQAASTAPEIAHPRDPSPRLHPPLRPRPNPSPQPPTHALPPGHVCTSSHEASGPCAIRTAAASQSERTQARLSQHRGHGCDQFPPGAPAARQNAAGSRSHSMSLQACGTASAASASSML